MSPEGRSHLGDALSGLLDGELGPAEEETARAHLVGCPACASELAGVRQARAWLRALPPVDAPSGFYQGLLAGGPVTVVSPPAPVPAGRRRRAVLAAIGAAAAAVTVLGVGSPRQSPVSPAVPRLVEAHATSASVGADLFSKLAPIGVPVSFGR